VFKFSKNRLALDRHCDVDLNTELATGRARPQ
jgi:hypothetical protein